MRHIDTLDALAVFLEADLLPYDASHGITQPGIRLDMAATQLARAVRAGELLAIAIAHRLIIPDNDKAHALVAALGMPYRHPGER